MSGKSTRTEAWSARGMVLAWLDATTVHLTKPVWMGGWVDGWMHVWVDAWVDGGRKPVTEDTGQDTGTPRGNAGARVGDSRSE